MRKQSLFMADRAADLIQTRTTLIRRLKNWQDQSSWQEFFDSYWMLIYEVARKAGLNEAEAEDVVQDTMISVAKNMPGFDYNREVGSFKGWLLKLTRWRIVDQFRKRKKTKALSSVSGEHTANEYPWPAVLDPTSGDLDRLWEEEWKKNLLEAAIANIRLRLSPRQYQIFDFYVNKEWPPSKVAEKFRISVDQVYIAKYRVAELIQAEVKRLQREQPE